MRLRLKYSMIASSDLSCVSSLKWQRNFSFSACPRLIMTLPESWLKKTILCMIGYLYPRLKIYIQKVAENYFVLNDSRYLYLCSKKLFVINLNFSWSWFITFNMMSKRLIWTVWPSCLQKLNPCIKLWKHIRYEETHQNQTKQEMPERPFVNLNV